MKSVSYLLVLSMPFLFSACSSVKRTAAEYGIGKTKIEEEREKIPLIVRPENTQGLKPSADQAVHTVRKLHQKLFPGQSGIRVLSVVKGDTAIVKNLHG